MGAQVTVTTSLLNGKLVPRIVDPKGLGEKETISEALDYGFVLGKPEQIAYNCKGVLKSMVNGVSKDGCGRKIDEFFSLQPYAGGRLDDVTDDIDRSKVSVTVRARALKRLRLDTSDWNVVLEGTTGNLVINAISTGERTGEILVGGAVGVNGFGLRLGEGDTVRWSVPGTDRSGLVPASMVESDMTRLTVAGEALAELNAPEFNGKTIVFDLRVGTNRGIKSAILAVA